MRKPREPKPEVLACRPFLDGVDTLLRAGVPLGAFSPAVRSTLTRVRATQEWIPWEVFLDAMDQGRAALGGDEAMIRAFEQFEGGEPEMIAFSAPDVTVQAFVRGIFDSYGGGSFPHVANEHRELPDGSVELRLSVPDTFRDTSAFWLACVGANRTLPCRMGLPPAKVEYDFTPHRLFLRLTFVTAPRKRRKDSGARRVEAFTEVVRTLRESVARALDRPARSLEERIAGFTQQWSLTPRQTEVLACICRGATNQDIANQLGCARKTVELHVSELLRKSGLDSRVQIVSLLLSTESPSSSEG